jgi:hypothetical protein
LQVAKERFGLNPFGILIEELMKVEVARKKVFMGYEIGFVTASYLQML